ncbi:F0F1 ATP synthase subunit gamma [uncultured Bacteroides sp.]|uniref:F0F1 ATP synthase subunit gamma n=1 Tax=uncultured Bacteroides sp. TaxID=162156 RepID=UPI002AAC1439|nr:F0F1 ATP synthase subunit gamma [uncultured Bacteroides sp.]
MASLKEVKGRIASVNSTRKITSAMKMVASAKLHRAQNSITNMLPYEKKLHAMLTAFLSNEADIQSPYMEVRPVKRVAIVAFSSNSSLCGAYNANVARQLNLMVEGYESSIGKENILVYAVGKKIAHEAKKEGFNVAGEFLQMADKPSYQETFDLVQKLMKMFVDKEIDKVELLYHHFKNTASQILTRETYLPVELPPVEKSNENHWALDYIFEPSEADLLATLVPQVLGLRLYTALLDSNASEHAARTMAMQIATDNANEIIQDLTVLYNKSRQQAITNELLDIIGGSFK